MLLKWSMLAVGLAAAGTPPPGQPEKPPSLHGAVLRFGPVSINPQIGIRSIGFDTNVFYTPDDRRADALADARPGIATTVRITDAWWLQGDGGVSIIYFVRTASQRHLGAGGSARVGYGTRSLSVSAGYASELGFGRLVPEIDRRLVSRSRVADARIAVKIGNRLAVEMSGDLKTYDFDTIRSLGANSDRMDRDVQSVSGALAYSLTQKTLVFVESEYRTDRFAEDAARELVSVGGGGGLAVSSETLLSLRAAAGGRRIRRRDGQGEARTFPYLQGDFRWPIGPRTRFEVSGTRDMFPSAFAAEDPRSLGVTMLQTYRGRIERDLIGNLDLWLIGAIASLRTEGRVLISIAGYEENVRRTDRSWEAGADLGYTFRRMRIGAAATYTLRRSNVRDLGIRGLVIGATASLRP